MSAQGSERSMIFLRGEDIYDDYRTTPDNPYNWYVLDDDEIKKAPGMASQLEIPVEMRNVMSYANAVWESKIYFIGGESSADQQFSDSEPPVRRTVFAFDVRYRQWSQCADMLLPRWHHKAVAAKDRIYAFDNRFYGKESQWMERYDIQHDTWELIDKSYPPVDISGVLSVAVHESSEGKTTIIFYIFPFYLLFFDVDTETWSDKLINNFCPPTPHFAEVIAPPSPYRVPVWSNRVAIIGDVVFWHTDGDVYAYDIIKERVLEPVPLLTFEDSYFSDFKKSIYYQMHSPETRSFLFNRDATSLVLFWHDEDDSQFRLRSFKVEHGHAITAVSTRSTLFADYLRDVLLVKYTDCPSLKANENNKQVKTTHDSVGAKTREADEKSSNVVQGRSEAGGKPATSHEGVVNEAGNNSVVTTTTTMTRKKKNRRRTRKGKNQVEVNKQAIDERKLMIPPQG